MVEIEHTMDIITGLGILLFGNFYAAEFALSVHLAQFIYLLIIIIFNYYYYYFLYKWLQDDILPKLMTSVGSYEDLFRKEISKYDHICEEIAQNIKAQEQLLMQIQVCFSLLSCLFKISLPLLLHIFVSFVLLMFLCLSVPSSLKEMAARKCLLRIEDIMSVVTIMSHSFELKD